MEQLLKVQPHISKPVVGQIVSIIKTQKNKDNKTPEKITLPVVGSVHVKASRFDAVLTG